MRLSAKEIMLENAQSSFVLHEIDENERSRLQYVLVRMLNDVMNFCEKVSIKVALVGGSALGAIRHK